MSPKSLFAIILKLMGLFFLKDFLESIPLIVDLFKGFNQGFSEVDRTTYFISISILLFYLLLIYIFIFKTNIIINLFKLDKGFIESTFEFSLSPITIMKIGIIVLAGMLLVYEIPRFCTSFYRYFQERKINFGPKPSLEPLIFSGLKILIGLLLLGERNRIASFTIGKTIKSEHGT